MIAFAKIVLFAAILTVLLCTVYGVEHYPSKWENININDILVSDRLLESYKKCLMDEGKCTAEGSELKKHLPDALKTECSKCSTKQKENIEKVVDFLINNRKDFWEVLQKKYDPTGIYYKKMTEKKKGKEETIGDKTRGEKNNESDLKSPTKRSTKRSTKEAAKESAVKEVAKETAKEAPKDSVKEAAKEPTKEPSKEPAKESGKEQSKESGKETKKFSKRSTGEQTTEPSKDAKEDSKKESVQKTTTESQKGENSGKTLKDTLKHIQYSQMKKNSTDNN